MMARLSELKPGEEFYTKGDWQTEPGYWRVLEQIPEYGSTYCEAITHTYEGRSTWRGGAVVARKTSIARS